MLALLPTGLPIADFNFILNDNPMVKLIPFLLLAIGIFIMFCFFASRRIK